MSKFLDTQAISSELMHLIKSAKEKIVLVSPYLKVNTQIQERLKTKSKIGTISEISIIFGKSELKQSELTWMKEIDDLRVFEKSNVHAKCYLNEEQAIICSMNLYDYSQQNNIEMGLLITKKEDLEAYQDLIDEIANIKINGKRLDLKKDELKSTKSSKKVQEVSHSEITLTQLLRKKLLERYRSRIAKSDWVNQENVISDEAIHAIISKDVIYWEDVKAILTNKQLSRYGRDIMDQFYAPRDLVIGEILEVQYQTNEKYYDRIKFKEMNSNKISWLDTTQELPVKGAIVGASLNGNWFNDYIYLKN